MTENIGTYTPTTTDDEVSLPQEYSIRTAESRRLTNDQKAEYAAFTGSDNRRYYAKSTTAEISNVDVGCNTKQRTIIYVKPTTEH